MSLDIHKSNNRFNPRQIKMMSDFYDSFFSVDGLKGDSNLDAWKMLVDPGLNRQIEWTPVGDKPLFAPKLIMMNRHGLIARILDRHIENQEKDSAENFQVLAFDIQDFSAYNIIDENNVAGGDYMVNMIAQSIKMTCDQYLVELKFMQEDAGLSTDKLKSMNIIPARYGGDEFAILINGQISDEAVNDLKTKLKENLGDLQGYFMQSNGQVGIRHTQLKNNEINSIVMPQDAELQEIFVSFLKNNILLDSIELDKIFKDQDACTSVTISKVIYPKSSSGQERNLDEKLAWITSKDPVYGKMIDHLFKLDRHNGNETYRLKALKFFELTMYNDIFQRKMLSYQQFADRISAGKFKAVCVFDISWLKEMNSLNMARGDLLLRAFYAKIIQGLSPIQDQRVDITRKGGTFIVGIKDNSNFNLENILENIRISMNAGLDIVIDGVTINVPCGYSHSRKTSNSKLRQQGEDGKSKFEASDTIISQIRNDADRNKIENLCFSLLRNPDNQKKLIELLQIKLNDTENRDNSELSPVWVEGWFWLNYLTGKSSFCDTILDSQTFSARYTDRCRLLMNRIRLISLSSSQYQTDDTVLLADILKQIINKMKE